MAGDVSEDLGSGPFVSCHLLTTDIPYHVRNDWTDIQIGVCTRPTAS